MTKSHQHSKVPDIPPQRNRMNTAEKEGIYFTPAHKIEAALQRTEDKFPKPTRQKKPIISLYDEDMYSLPDLSEGSTSTLPVQGRATDSTQNNTVPKIWKLTISKRCAVIVSLVCCVVVIAIIGAIIATSMPKEGNRKIMYILIKHFYQ